MKKFKILLTNGAWSFSEGELLTVEEIKSSYYEECESLKNWDGKVKSFNAMFHAQIKKAQPIFIAVNVSPFEDRIKENQWITKKQLKGMFPELLQNWNGKLKQLNSIFDEDGSTNKFKTVY
jgi:hypothetical protein